MNTRIKEIDKQLSALYAEKELLEDQEKAAKASNLIKLLSKGCSFYVTQHLAIELYASSKEFEEEVFNVTNALSDGWHHFSAPLAPQIELRGEHGRYAFQFKPANTSDERFKKECDSEYQFQQIVLFLKSVGVTPDKFDFEEFDSYIKKQEETLKDLKKDRLTAFSIVNSYV